MYSSERIGVVVIIIISNSKNKSNNRGIEAIPGLFGLNGRWAAHFFRWSTYVSSAGWIAFRHELENACVVVLNS
jgi:hypothetical protein